MREKVLVISNCVDCCFFDEEINGCRKLQRTLSIRDIYDIPEDCPLEDKKEE